MEYRGRRNYGFPFWEPNAIEGVLPVQFAMGQNIAMLRSPAARNVCFSNFCLSGSFHLIASKFSSNTVAVQDKYFKDSPPDFQLCAVHEGVLLLHHLLLLLRSFCQAKWSARVAMAQRTIRRRYSARPPRLSCRSTGSSQVWHRWSAKVGHDWKTCSGIWMPVSQGYSSMQGIWIQNQYSVSSSLSGLSCLAVSHRARKNEGLPVLRIKSCQRSSC